MATREDEELRIVFEHRIEQALLVAATYGVTDSIEQKAWAMDQMVRALTGCFGIPEFSEGSKEREFDGLHFEPEFEGYRRFEAFLGSRKWDRGTLGGKMFKSPGKCLFCQGRAKTGQYHCTCA